jgi:uncharacterized protein (DUF1501 family)
MTSRRIFLKNGAFAMVGLGFAPSFLTRTVLADGRASRTKRLIAIFQRGAMDGLNAVIPFGDEEYYRARPTIAIARPAANENTAIDLDGFFGLNPQLRALKPLWDARQLAVVHACGSPNATRSHFDAQDYMETATPDLKTADGWLNRYLRARHVEQATPLRAVALSPQLPRALQGAAPALALPGLAQFSLRGDAAETDKIARRYLTASDTVLNATAREAIEAMRILKTADPAWHQPENGAQYPESPFGQAMKQIAQLTKADVGLEVAFAEVGGWDTHVNQGAADGVLSARLGDFSRSLAAFAIDLGYAMDDTVVLTMSEFGRAVGENGNRGTDHGHANAMMVIGGGVGGGKVYGAWPGLAVEQRYDRRDLAVTTDFRDVFGEIVVRHLGVTDPSAVFPGYGVDPRRFPGLFRPGPV